MIIHCWLLIIVLLGNGNKNLNILPHPRTLFGAEEDNNSHDPTLLHGILYWLRLILHIFTFKQNNVYTCWFENTLLLTNQTHIFKQYNIAWVTGGMRRIQNPYVSVKWTEWYQCLEQLMLFLSFGETQDTEIETGCVRVHVVMWLLITVELLFLDFAWLFGHNPL